MLSAVRNLVMTEMQRESMDGFQSSAAEERRDIYSTRDQQIADMQNRLAPSVLLLHRYGTDSNTEVLQRAARRGSVQVLSHTYVCVRV
jgi:hypothetical protein